MFRLVFLAGLAKSMAEDVDAAWFAEAEQSLGESLKRDLEARELAQHSGNATTSSSQQATTNGNYTATVEVKGSTTMKAKVVAACDTTDEMAGTACTALKNAYVEGVCTTLTFLITGKTATAITYSNTAYNVACTGTVAVSARRALEEEQGAQSRELQTQKSLTISYTWKVPVLPAHADGMKTSANTNMANNWSSALTKMKEYVEASLTTLANSGSALVCATCKTVSDVVAAKPAATSSGATVEASAWRVISVALVAAVSTIATLL